MRTCRANARGFTLTRFLLFVSCVIGMMLVVFGLVSRASTDSRSYQVVAGVRSMVSNIHHGFQGREDYAGLSNATLLAKGYLPTTLLAPPGSPDIMRTPWGGAISVRPVGIAGGRRPADTGGIGVVIDLARTPAAACSEILTALSVDAVWMERYLSPMGGGRLIPLPPDAPRPTSDVIAKGIAERCAADGWRTYMAVYR